MVGMSGHELFQNLTRLLEISGGAMSIAAQVVDVLDLWIEFGSPVKVCRRRGPFALAIIGIGARIDVRRFFWHGLDSFCVFLNGAIPIADSRIFTSEHEMKIWIFGVAFNRVPEFEH